MKKVISLALAVIMALSMTAMAFAAETTTAKATPDEPLKACPVCGIEFRDGGDFNDHLALCRAKTCSKCGEVFAGEAEYNVHVEKCTVGDTKDYVDLTIKEILNAILEIVKGSMSQWDGIEDVVVRIIDFIENIGTGLVPEADVNGAIAELEGLNIPGIDGLLDQLKAKIKALYAGEVATTVAETTAAAPADTGSASVGIAVFAAVSVAAAAAYVCTKKD